jgi:hypothetical protein
VTIRLNFRISVSPEIHFSPLNPPFFPPGGGKKELLRIIFVVMSFSPSGGDGTKCQRGSYTFIDSPSGGYGTQCQWRTTVKKLACG